MNYNFGIAIEALKTHSDIYYIQREDRENKIYGMYVNSINFSEPYFYEMDLETHTVLGYSFTANDIFCEKWVGIECNTDFSVVKKIKINNEE